MQFPRGFLERRRQHSAGRHSVMIKPRNMPHVPWSRQCVSCIQLYVEVQACRQCRRGLSGAAPLHSHSHNMPHAQRTRQGCSSCASKCMLAASVGVVLPLQPRYIHILKNYFVVSSDSQHASLTLRIQVSFRSKTCNRLANKAHVPVRIAAPKYGPVRENRKAVFICG